MVKKKRKAILIGIVLIVVLVGVITIKHCEKNRALEECISAGEKICQEHNIVNIEVEIKYSSKWEGYDVYYIYIDGMFDENDMQDAYLCVKEIEALQLDIDSALLLSQIKLNGKYYSLDVRDDSLLVCEHNVVYTYISDEDADMRERLKNRLPYEGMPEKYIEYTLLGKPDEVEYCAYYSSLEPRAQSIEYTWYDDEGHLEAIATVEHWDYATDNVVDGYISHLMFWGKYYDVDNG